MERNQGSKIIDKIEKKGLPINRWTKESLEQQPIDRLMCFVFNLWKELQINPFYLSITHI